MHGFQIVLADGGTSAVEALKYEVTDDGTLVLFGGGVVVEDFVSGTWVEISEFGERLSDDWPHPELDRVLRSARDLMASFGSMNRIRSEDFTDWRLNDLDTFVSEIVATDGIDARSTDHSERRMIEKLRGVVTRGFGLNEFR